MALLETAAPRSPFTLFRRWYAEAVDAGAPQPDAMTLATAGSNGEPSARMVLFKGLSLDQFVFYTNYQSRKGNDLSANPRAALVFYWFVTHHQVRVVGRVRRLSREASVSYFHSRPRGAQLSALASRQSTVVASRAVLETAVAELARRHPKLVPTPADWGGFAVRPGAIEFWESRDDRLHDRLRYVRRPGGAWRVERLAP